jgi:hypothetical protein
VLLCLFTVSPVQAKQTVIVLVGAPGNDTYQAKFLEWTERWKQVAAKSDASFQSIGVESGETHDRQRLLEILSDERSDGESPLWLVLIGHGTFDGRVAKFNLRGPDVSAAELAVHLKQFTRPLAIVNCASASAPFINQLSSKNRVIVTATKSGFEYNYARFGRFMSEAISDTKADLDKDDQTSLLEAFLLAASRVTEFYESDARLTTENAAIDDNGDGLGTPATWFRGVRTTRTAKDNTVPDGLRANQFFLLRSAAELQLSPDERQQRDQLEQRLEELRARKPSLDSGEYYDLLQEIMLELATIYAAAESGEGLQ